MNKKYLLATLSLIVFIGFCTFHLFHDVSDSQEIKMSPETKMMTGSGGTTASNQESGPPPKIKFDKQDLTYDFGTVSQMSKTEKVIKFKNVGKGTLKILKVKPG